MSNMDLFSSEEHREPLKNLQLKDAEVLYQPYFYTETEAHLLFNTLYKEVEWQQDDITVFGKTYAQPRLTALYGESDAPYSYSNITMYPKAYTPSLQKIKKDIEKACGIHFTTTLLNLYRNGSDSNGWHSDDEKELGKNPIIASLSLGQERMFHLKHKQNKELKHKIVLGNGSLLLMKGQTQHTWQHQIPKTKKIVDPRINLTFRIIKSS